MKLAQLLVITVTCFAVCNLGAMEKKRKAADEEESGHKRPRHEPGLTETEELDVNWHGFHGNTLLHVSAEVGNLERVRKLIEEYHMSVDVVNHYGGTPLMAAARRGHIAIVEALLAAGANVNAVNNSGETAFFEAAINDHVAIVDRLLREGINVDLQANDGSTALMHAAYQGNSAIVELLIREGANVNARTNDGSTVLMYALGRDDEYDNEESVEMLLRAGADVNAHNNEGSTALMRAAFQGNMPIVNRLLRAGAGVNAVDSRGITVLMHAAMTERPEIIELLIREGAHIDAQDNDGSTALMHAATEENPENVEILVREGANINVQDRAGSTPLKWAILYNEVEIVKKLIHSSSDRKVKITNINIALDLVNKTLKEVGQNNNDKERLLEMQAFLQKELAALMQATETKESVAAEKKKEAAEKKEVLAQRQAFPAHDFAVRFVKIIDGFIQQNAPDGRWDDSARKQVLDAIEKLLFSTRDLGEINNGLKNSIDRIIAGLYKGDEETRMALRNRLVDLLQELMKEILGRLQAAAGPYEPRRRDDEGSAGAIAKLKKHMKITPGVMVPAPKKREPTMKKRHRIGEISSMMPGKEVSA